MATLAFLGIIWALIMWHVARTQKDQMEMHLLIIWGLMLLSGVIGLIRVLLR